MNTTEVVGIIGAAGDLGTKLSLQAAANFSTVFTFDIAPPKREGLIGIDATLIASDAINPPQPLSSARAIFENCTVIHWVAPLAALQVTGLSSTSMLVLHDSVMANSVAAAQVINQDRLRGSAITVAHCLTNTERSVVVASDVGDAPRLCEHIRQLGLVPKLMPNQEHDAVMAHSQGLFALVCRLYRQDLERYAADGLLTPSGQRLLTAIEDNESRWTPITYDAIISNPEMKDVIRTMLEAIS